MTGLTAALYRHQGRMQALQAQAVRAAVWGDADQFRTLVGALNGDTQRGVVDDSELDAALAAFGFVRET